LEHAVLKGPKFKLVQLELMDAIKDTSVKLLLVALDTAKSAGVEDGLISSAELRLVLLKLLDATCENDPVALARCIRAARDARVDKEPLDSAKKKLKTLDESTHADIIGEDLQMAFEGADAETLSTAIQAAEALDGFEEQDLRPPRKRLSCMLVAAAYDSTDTAVP